MGRVRARVGCHKWKNVTNGKNGTTAHGDFAPQLLLNKSEHSLIERTKKTGLTSLN